jgi:ABC-type Mn2+/Zn2+ transport system ATPase subunit
MTAAIETVDLTRRFGRLEAVSGLNLRVPAGSIFALIGPNGAGKTTAIKLLLNLLRPTRGQALVLGTDARRLGPPELARIGYVSENQRLPDWMTPSQGFGTVDNPGFPPLAVVIMFHDSRNSSGHQVLLDSQWLEQAELVIVRSTQVGSVERRVAIPNLPIRLNQ